MQCDKNPSKIKNMFNEISAYYDTMNNVISLGTHYIIKSLAIRQLNPQPRTNILDLCCGSGDFTKILSTFYPRSKVIGLDFSPDMLKIAKIKNPKKAFILADCTNIPFKNDEFDYVTIGFGLRNIENRSKAISEIYRVLNKNGKFLHLDFGKKNLLNKIFDIVIPIFVKLFRKNSKHYRYLLESKNSFPEPGEIIKEFKSHGFVPEKTCNYMFGTISVQIMKKS